ncbi:hypothetical protein [Deinococcus multiflagellatus]|uniref:Uncharacterized protein n=1 Tax=Deinococcus multiflagellatus TaxID=1656887 RepID=A0ABW1ZJ22_9DEIO|nr:hypothetical protein [Deinococcus multiflagellatus]MBZ9713093.1 hypothetical protein [Deinococcus multiflagellatus]
MKRAVWRPLALVAVLGLLAAAEWQARQGRAAQAQAARAYAQAVRAAAQQAWSSDPGRPFVEVGSAESCGGPAYRGVRAPQGLGNCEVTRLPVGFEVNLTLGRVTLRSAAR